MSGNARLDRSGLEATISDLRGRLDRCILRCEVLQQRIEAIRYRRALEANSGHRGIQGQDGVRPESGVRSSKSGGARLIAHGEGSRGSES